jgi:hypothetical protein
MEDELDVMYVGAMEVTNNGNLPDGYDWDMFGHIYSAVNLRGKNSLIVRNK